MEDSLLNNSKVNSSTAEKMAKNAVHPVIAGKAELAAHAAAEARIHQELGRLFWQLVKASRLIMLSRDGGDDDFDDAEDLGEYRICQILNGSYRTCARRTLLDALRAAAESESYKFCQRCRKCRPFSSFPAKKDALDGRRGWCRACERKRNSKWYPRKSRGKSYQAG